VHHTGHGNGDRARGSSVIPASLDNEFKVVRDKNSPDDEMHLTFEQTLNKDSLSNARIAFKLVDHTVTINDKKISSAYLEKIEFNFDDSDEMTFLLKQIWLAFEAETAVRAAEKDVPEHEIFLTQSDFYPTRVFLKENDEGKSVYMNKDQVKYQFTQMVKKNLIYKLDKMDGYQKFEFKNISSIGVVG
jgi:hypothetical protein